MFEKFIKSLYMDFEGQKRAENYFERIIVLSGIIGLVVGYVLQQFELTLGVLGSGFLLAALITIPPWPMYRRTPVKWQKHDPKILDPSASKESSSSTKENHPKTKPSPKPSPKKGGKKQS